MDVWSRRQEGNWQWTVLPEWEFLFGGLPERPLERWSRLYQMECVKQGPHRAVYRVQTPQGAFYAKHYRAPRWTDPWRNFFRGCPAQREFQTLLAVAERGIPTLRPIGWAKPVGWAGLCNSLLLTEAIPNAISLDEYFQTLPAPWSSIYRSKISWSFLRHLAQFLAQCHQAGIQHQDLHTGNILVVAGETAEEQGEDSYPRFRFFLTDGQAVRLGKPLDRPTSLKNLALLAGAWRERTTPSQRWYFWKQYCQARPEIGFDLPSDAERIDRLGFEHRLRLYGHRDRRLFRTNPNVMRLSFAGGKIFALANQNLQHLWGWASAPEALLEQSLHRAVKLGHHSVVVEADWPVPEEAGEPNAFYRVVQPPREDRLDLKDGAGQAKAFGGVAQASLAEHSSIPPPHFAHVGTSPRSGGNVEIAALSSEARAETRSLFHRFASFAPKMGGSMPTTMSPDPTQGSAQYPAPLGDKSTYLGQNPSFTSFSARENRNSDRENEIFNPPKDVYNIPFKEDKPPKKKLVELDHPPFRVALKRIREGGGWRGWLRYLRWSRARRAWWAGHVLLQRGIATPLPIALYEPPSRTIPYYSYLVTEWIPQAQNLHLWGWQIARLPEAERFRLACQCAESLGRLVGRLHAYRIRHGDLNMTNILVRAEADKVRTWLLDVDRIRIGGRFQRGYLKDLLRLAQGLPAHPWVPPSVVCRFFRAYLKQFPAWARPDWKSLWRRLQQELTRWQEKKANPPLL